MSYYYFFFFLWRSDGRCIQKKKSQGKDEVIFLAGMEEKKKDQLNLGGKKDGKLLNFKWMHRSNIFIPKA